MSFRCGRVGVGEIRGSWFKQLSSVRHNTLHFVVGVQWFQECVMRDCMLFHSTLFSSCYSMFYFPCVAIRSVPCSIARLETRSWLPLEMHRSVVGDNFSDPLPSIACP